MIGAIAGLAGALLGVGGGFVMVPLQVMWLRADHRLASGTSLAAILPIALAGAVVYYFGPGGPHIDLTVAAFVVVGGSVGTIVGSQVAQFVPERILKIVVAVLVFVGALKELHDGFLGGAMSLPGVDYATGPFRDVLLTGAGLVIGILSGLSGVGGGVLMVPLLVLGFGVAQRVAQGTSLLAIIPISALGALVHLRNREVDGGALWRMSVTGAPAALVGGVLAILLSQRSLAGLFGIFLLVAAFRLWPRGEDPA